ncbi:centromere protein X-like [Dysidea avara]|uniref:centromere protein X-like n=1 Tax=Dysidea avara TaxID=196820 RepID=UPI00331800ED
MDTNSLKQETVLEILKLFFKDQKTKVSGDSQKLITDVIYLFILEAAHRTATQAQNEQVDETEIHHFEKVLPKLLLDF